MVLLEESLSSKQGIPAEEISEMFPVIRSPEIVSAERMKEIENIFALTIDGVKYRLDTELDTI